MKTITLITSVSALAMLLGCRAPAEPVGESYCGMCDASAVIALNDDLFVIADDEDTIMRVYSRAKGGAAVFRTNLSAFLGFGPTDEADIEGGARIGDHFYWITSHGNNRKGREQESRQRLFAVVVNQTNGAVSITASGRPYARLLDDLLSEPRLTRFNLKASIGLPPKTPGALNIEGLTATPEGHLLIGFRNPIPRDGALIVPLLNPAEVIQGQKARLGEPRQISLGGYGIRSMERWGDGYLIIAGSADGKGKSRLYEWSGGTEQPRLIPGVDFEGINPEAISVGTRHGLEEVFVVSDDGTRKIDGLECKKLKDPMKKTFRAMGVSLTPQMARH
ncbi:MAG TPA: DUF3616 domain-containing protein [Candidatus Limnocylindria bacterium]|nr:DUF3616 domain-containing protein [Candidatus Limnocylindria bacterium]